MRQNTTNTQKTPIYFRSAFIPSILLAVTLFGAAYYVYSYSIFSPRNYAAEIAKPIESKLVEAGAVKKCDEADNGRGWDNRKPWYDAQFEISASKVDSLEFVKKKVAEAGYMITESDFTNTRGDLSYQDLSKKSLFSDLQDGSQELRITIFNSSIFTDANKQSCTIMESKDAPADKTIVRMSLRLPAFR